MPGRRREPRFAREGRPEPRSLRSPLCQGLPLGELLALTRNLHLSWHFMSRVFIPILSHCGLTERSRPGLHPDRLGAVPLTEACLRGRGLVAGVWDWGGAIIPPAARLPLGISITAPSCWAPAPWDQAQAGQAATSWPVSRPLCRCRASLFQWRGPPWPGLSAAVHAGLLNCPCQPLTVALHTGSVCWKHVGADGGWQGACRLPGSGLWHPGNQGCGWLMGCW